MAVTTKASCLTLLNRDTASGQVATTIAVSAFAAQGCSVRGITVGVQTSGGTATLAIAGGGNTLLNAATSTAPQAVGGYVLPLTTTAANLLLASSDSIVITTAGGDNSQCDTTILYGDVAPPSVTNS